MRTLSIDYDSDQPFFEANHFREDQKLIGYLTRRFKLQKEILKKKLMKAKPSMDVSHLISPEALNDYLKRYAQSDAMGRESEIYNMIYFDFQFANNARLHKQFFEIEMEIAKRLLEKVRNLFTNSEDLYLWNSGNNLYPPGGYLGWHTNNNNADMGWRLYTSYTEEPGKSFFRYLDPITKEIITSNDSQWNFRLFNISRKRPFWHCVYTDTSRISMGYLIQRKAVIKRKYQEMRLNGYQRRVGSVYGRSYRWLAENYPHEYKRLSVWFNVQINSLIWDFIRLVRKTRIVYTVKKFLRLILKEDKAV